MNPAGCRAACPAPRSCVSSAVFSAHATRVDVCIFNAPDGRELERFELPEYTDEVFHGHIRRRQAGHVLWLPRTRSPRARGWRRRGLSRHPLCRTSGRPVTLCRPFGRRRVAGGSRFSTVARTCRATGEALLAPARNRRSTVDRITGATGKSIEGERVTDGFVVALRRGNARGAKEPCCL